MSLPSAYGAVKTGQAVGKAIPAVGKGIDKLGRNLFRTGNEDLGGIRQNQVDLLQKLLKPGGYNSLPDYFGQLGSPTTALQRQSTDALSHFLDQPDPGQRALDVSMPALQAILNGKPGQGVIDALQPSFDRNLASANQQGGRFSSGNAILRSRAVDDFNLLGANAAQQGQQTQLQAANSLQMLSQNAGQGQLQRLLGAFGVGQAGAQQNDLETQRRIEIMNTIMGGGQGVAFGAGKPAGGPGNQILEMLATLIGKKAGG